MSSDNSRTMKCAAIIASIAMGIIAGAIAKSIIFGVLLAAVLISYFQKVNPFEEDIEVDEKRHGVQVPSRGTDAHAYTPTNISLDFRRDGTGESSLAETEYFCAIAGAKYRNNSEFGFIGYVKPDTSNAYDKSAIGIYRLDGTLIGYLPKDEQADYRAWSNRDILPCVGIIYEGYNGDLRGSVKIIDADRPTTEVHIIKFVIWIVKNHGRGYIPREYKQYSSFRGDTDDAWIEYLMDVCDTRNEERKALAKAKRDRIKRAKAAITTSEDKGE